MSAFARFEQVVRDLRPQTAVVLGSGLGGSATRFRETASITFADVPGLVPPTVHGHTGRIAVGTWNQAVVLLFLGRLHFYEGHPREVVTSLVRVAASLGIRRLILTNAAGGVNPSLGPGALMAIRAHINLVGDKRWHTLATDSAVVEAYSLPLIESLRAQECAAGRELLDGVYAALTGPCYETPAEIRALAACGADAVGMSTALEAEAAAELGLEVAGISCITNKAAGLSGETLNHAEVLANAQLAVEGLGELIASTLACQ